MTNAQKMTALLLEQRQVEMRLRDAVSARGWRVVERAAARLDALEMEQRSLFVAIRNGEP